MGERKVDFARDFLCEGFYDFKMTKMCGNNPFRSLLAFAIPAWILIFFNVLFAADFKEVDDDGLVAEFYYHKNAKDKRPIIIFGGSGGGYFLAKDQRSEFAEALVDEGYAVLCLAYFDPDGNGKLPNSLKRIPLEYFETAMAWIGRQPEVRNDSIAVYGASRGGELALLLASHYPKISMVIAVVPSAYVWSTPSGHTFKSIVQSIFNPCAPAWTYQGKDIPGICNWKMVISGDNVTEDPKRFEKYIIPVERMSADVLLLSGKQDEIWPSTDMCDRIVARLDQFHYPHEYKHIAYDAGHYVFGQSWNDFLSFLKAYYPADF